MANGMSLAVRVSKPPQYTGDLRPFVTKTFHTFADAHVHGGQFAHIRSVDLLEQVCKWQTRRHGIAKQKIESIA